MARLLLLSLFLIAGAAYSVVARKLTPMAAITGVLLALSIYAGAGFTGIFMMAFFFLAGTAATTWKMKWKQQLGLAESNKGTRTVQQVLANAGVAAIAGLATLIFPATAGLTHLGFPATGTLAPLAIAAAFSSATADTLSSELGNIYGKRYINITDFKKSQRGPDGVISLEGTLCGLAGSTLIASIYGAGFAWDRNVLIIIGAGTIGNLADSLLGATLERKGWIGNNAVNFLNTAIAAFSALLLARLG
jgi:uncharacterized protein (TIGR00297 family)